MTLMTQTSPDQQNSRIFILLFMSMLSAFGPFVTDFYLPALPQLVNNFDTTTSLVQLTLTFSMLGLATGQMIIGPLSDKLGRRTPLIISLILFVISTVACLYANDIHTFIVCRLIQGFAAAGGLVISRSIVTDLYAGNALARTFSLMAAINGIAPVGAPVLGGIMLEWTDWRGIFIILLAIGIILTLISFGQKETLLPENRFQGGILSTFTQLVPVLRNRQFTFYLLIQTFAMGVLFSYIAASPFIFQQHYEISPMLYSICFGLNAFAIMIGSSLLTPRFSSATTALRVGATVFFILGLCVAAALVADLSFAVVEGLLFVMMFFFGMVMPTSTALALDLERKSAGNASALLGFTQFLFGGIVSPLTGMGNILITTGIIIALCCGAMYLFTRIATQK